MKKLPILVVLTFALVSCAPSVVASSPDSIITQHMDMTPLPSDGEGASRMATAHCAKSGKQPVAMGTQNNIWAGTISITWVCR